jgi:hypothetical protein
MKEAQIMTDTPLPVRKRVTPENPAEITSLSGVLSPDQGKVRVTVELSLDSTRPDIELILKDAKGEEICRSTIIENFGAKVEFTMHIRQPQIELPLTLTCGLSYEDDQLHEEKDILVQQTS